MLKRKLGLLVAAAVMVGMFTSCVNVIKNDKGNEGSGDQTPTTQEPEIDYTDYKGGNFSIKVRNDSAKNVVCFVGSPRESNLISGAKAHDTTGLKLNPSLFGSSKDFVLFVVTEEDYLANKSDLSKLDNTPFAQIYAYYNAESAEANANMVYTISSFMGGDYYILINNSSKYNVELRQNGLYGESLAFAGAQTTQTKIAMSTGNYEIFPVFRKFNKKAGEIMTCFPKYTVEGEDYPVYFTFSLDNETLSQEFNTQDWFKNVNFSGAETPSAAYVTIYNGNQGTGVSLYKGANAEAAVTSTGGKTINGGKTLTFEVPMTSTGKYTYASTAKISGWRVGTSMKYVNIDELTVEAGKMYYLDVSGSTYADVKATWRVDEKTNQKVVDTVSFDEE